MRLARAWPVVLLVLVPALCADDKPKDKDKDKPEKPPTPAEEYRSLLQEYQKAQQKSPRQPQGQKFAARFLEFAEKHPKEPQALDALTWVTTRGGTGAEANKAKARAIEIIL